MDIVLVEFTVTSTMEKPFTIWFSYLPSVVPAGQKELLLRFSGVGNNNV